MLSAIRSVEFSKSFSEYVCIGDAITVKHNGFAFTATIEHDADKHIDDDDCHNTDQSVTGCNAEQQADLLAARKAWSNDEWFYCGVVISASHESGAHWDHLASLWGIEVNYPDSDGNNHLLTFANDLLAEAVENLLGQLEMLIKSLG
jgi:hypothetical protein